MHINILDLTERAEQLEAERINAENKITADLLIQLKGLGVNLKVNYMPDRSGYIEQGEGNVVMMFETPSQLHLWLTCKVTDNEEPICQ